MPCDPALGAGAEGSVVTDRLAHLTKEAWRAFVRELQGRLAEHDVSFGHWTFLRILWERDGLTQRELSDEAGVAEPSTNAAIKSMEELGYVTRKRLPDNRKNIYVRLTPKGRALRVKLVPIAQAVNRDAVRGVPARDVEAARRVLTTVTENLIRSSRRKP
ncbi:MAG TPA: MarR family transcriptional regulator [Burkholderiales bacterium]|nr:MarR family transcriptional regulator [Burkholderiales bacterium]